MCYSWTLIEKCIFSLLPVAGCRRSAVLGRKPDRNANFRGASRRVQSKLDFHRKVGLCSMCFLKQHGAQRLAFLRDRPPGNIGSISVAPMGVLRSWAIPPWGGLPPPRIGKSSFILSGAFRHDENCFQIIRCFSGKKESPPPLTALDHSPLNGFQYSITLRTFYYSAKLGVDAVSQILGLKS